MMQYLKDFTGLNEDYLIDSINRKKQFSYVDEFNNRKPKNNKELDWFYISAEKFIFANITHTPWKQLEKMEMEKGKAILDYGAGVGTDILLLARKGFKAYYFDINLIQREFVEFIAKRESLDVNFIKPYYNGKFNPIECINGKFDAVITRSLLEHVPYYERLTKHLINCLNKDGLFFEASVFGKSDKDPMHLEEKKPIDVIMKQQNMELIYNKTPHHCWKKN